jgi:integrase/recombinase XerD
MKQRFTFISRAAVDAVVEYKDSLRPQLEQPGRSGDAMWLSKRGLPFCEKNVWRVTRKYACRVGLGHKVSPHVLRHTYATHLLENGADLVAVQQLLGHAHLETTGKYVHTSPQRLLAVYQKFGPGGPAVEPGQ